jgi:hypothetical protein
MRIILLMSTFIAVVSCHPVVSLPDNIIPPANSRKVFVKLLDSMGTFTMYVPERYDTAFGWRDPSDCTTCARMKYRLQPCSLPIEMEGGFFWKPRMDSVDRLTLTYSPFFEREKSDSTWITMTHKYQLEKYDLRGLPRKELILDTLCQIYDRPFSITATTFYHDKPGQYWQQVTAITSVRMKDVEFKFERVTDKNDSITQHFAQDVMNLLQTVRFAKDPW